MIRRGRGAHRLEGPIVGAVAAIPISRHGIGDDFPRMRGLDGGLTRNAMKAGLACVRSRGNRPRQQTPTRRARMPDGPGFRRFEPVRSVRPTPRRIASARSRDGIAPGAALPRDPALGGWRPLAHDSLELRSGPQRPCRAPVRRLSLPHQGLPLAGRVHRRGRMGGPGRADALIPSRRRPGVHADSARRRFGDGTAPGCARRRVGQAAFEEAFTVPAALPASPRRPPSRSPRCPAGASGRRAGRVTCGTTSRLHVLPAHLTPRRRHVAGEN